MNEITLKAIRKEREGLPSLEFPKGEYYSFLREIPLNAEMVITISRKRSLNQNALFHKWINIISSEIGEDSEVVKYWLKCKFLGCEEKEIDGHTYSIPPETSKLNKQEMSDFMQRVYIFAAEELHVNLPSNEL